MRNREVAMPSGGGCGICLRGLLKLFNFLLAFIGLALVLYSLWILHKLPSLGLSSPLPHQLLHTDGFQGSFLHQADLHALTLPSAWFVYSLLGLGAVICLIAFSGHIAAETSNGCCLSCYIFFVVLLILLQGAFVADVFLNENWQEDLPADSTGLLDYIKKFVQENFDVCKWVGLAIVIIEALAVLFALCVRAITPSSRRVSYDSDDEYLLPRTRIRQPLLIQQGSDTSVPNTTVVEGWPKRPDAWSSKMRDKQYGLTVGQPAS